MLTSLRQIAMLIMATSLLYAGDGGAGTSIDPSRPFVAGWLRAMATIDDSLYADGDSVLVDRDSPNYKYPGRAMLLSFIVPGLGQAYVKHPFKGLAFVAVDLLAYSVYADYNRQGLDQVDFYRAFADSSWDFSRWFNNAPNFQGSDWEGVNIDQFGTHELEFVVEDMDGDGQFEFSGTTGALENRLASFMATDTAAFVRVRKSPEYYENIGKYNQFFSGWSDADPSKPDIEDTASGKVAWSPHRRSYVEQRGEANRLRSVATYAISAILFNHVASGVDALFSTSAWNMKHAVKVSSRLVPSRESALGVQGVEISLAW